ncbi:TPA: hypothetical protein ACQRX0_001904 [Acinetobacter baumannii]|uniref:hypothetical protein n=1 Tax=Acinetobacter baumannii TaxID=470 RepID=UPI001C047D8B|nr:hypothetical protein [Acinetobacter baumannii]MBU0386497.1 hypothetical protein [Acinetobacter baumannii]UMN51924.1 hypothetical protein L2Z17_10815 [Acinetobacter baumannii]
MAWKFIKLDKVVSQKECNNFLEKEENKKLLKLLRIQKTCTDGAITLKLYPKEGVLIEDALGVAYALIGLMVANYLQIDAHDI